MVIPLPKLQCQFLVLLSVRFKIGQRTGLRQYRSHHYLREWGIIEVCRFGIQVSIVKLIDFAVLSLGIDPTCFVALLLIQDWLEFSMPPRLVWDALSDE